jgi:hypothetical protein
MGYVVAVLRKHLPKHFPNPTKDVPDTGDLHNDVLILLRGIALPLQIIGAETIHGLMVEYIGKELMASIPEMMKMGTKNEVTIAMMTILKNAEQRGEISQEKISPRIISLHMDLIRYEFLITHEPISDKTLNEIVDDIFMPLVQK